MIGRIAKQVGRVLEIGMIMTVLTLSIAQAASPEMNAVGNAANASRHAEEPPAPLGPLSTAEKQGYGCLVAGGAALAVTAVVGAPDILMLFTGATAIPATGPFGVGLAVAGTAFASICAVGALVAPTAIRLWSYYVDGAEIVQKP
jgi:hypothetical protein